MFGVPGCKGHVSVDDSIYTPQPFVRVPTGTSDACMDFIKSAVMYKSDFEQSLADEMSSLFREIKIDCLEKILEENKNLPENYPHVINQKYIDTAEYIAWKAENLAERSTASFDLSENAENFLQNFSDVMHSLADSLSVYSQHYEGMLAAFNKNEVYMCPQDVENAELCTRAVFNAIYEDMSFGRVSLKSRDIQRGSSVEELVASLYSDKYISENAGSSSTQDKNITIETDMCKQ